MATSGLPSSRWLSLTGKLSLAVGSMVIAAIALAVISQSVVGHWHLDRVTGAAVVCLAGMSLAIVLEQLLLQPGLEFGALMMGMMARTALPLLFLLGLYATQGPDSARSSAYFVLPLYFVGLAVGAALSVAHVHLHSATWRDQRTNNHLGGTRGVGLEQHESQRAGCESFRS